MKNIKKSIALVLCIVALFSVASASAVAANKLSCPEKFAVTAVSSDAVKLSWTGCENVSGYRIYSYQNNKWKIVKETTGTTVVISGLLASNNYIFAIRSAKFSGGKLYLSDDNKMVSVRTKGLAAPVISGTSNESAIRVSWNRIPGAKGYAVYAYLSGAWKLVSVTANTSVSYGGLRAGSSYIFGVTGVTEVNGKYVKGPASNFLKVSTTDPNKVKVACTAVSDSAIRINWTKAASANGYRIYALLGGTWKAVKDIMDANVLSHTFRNIASDTTYKLRVRAFRFDGLQVRWFEPSEICVATTNPGMLDLYVYRTSSLKETFSKENYTFSYTVKDDKYGDISVKISKNGNKYRLDSQVAKIPYVLLNDENGDNFIILDESKSYIKVPGILSSTFDVSEVMENFFPEDSWTSEASVATFNSQKVVCESFKNPSRTKMLRFYYKTGKLVGIDEVGLLGLEERALVRSIESYSQNGIFTIPEGYNRLFFGGVDDMELIVNQFAS